MKLFKSYQPRTFLAHFVAGSLVVIFIALFSVSLWFSTQHVKQEQRRAELSQRQILEFFKNQYTWLAEEMWTKNFDSMSARVSEIAKQLGSEEFEVFISDVKGHCLYHVRNETVSRSCKTPNELAQFAVLGGPVRPDQASLQYDENRKRNVYLAPLVVGSILKGYLLASVSDPFDFYRGNFLSLALQNWLPPLLVVIILWTAWLLISKTYLIDPYLGSLVQLKRKEALAHQAQQVAHDLKNPVATILSIARTLKGIPEERRELITGAANSIKEIADGLLKESPGTSIPSVCYDISPIVRSAVVEAQSRFSEKSGITIKLSEPEESCLINVALEPIDLKRILHNLIANSVDAIGTSGAIWVKITEADGLVAIRVTDNGHGIPTEILPKLGIRGASFGKTGGSGLGLFSAKETLSRVGGTFNITSEIGQGTTVTVKIPTSERLLSLFPSALTIPRGGTIAILDDEKISHQYWDVRLKDYDGEKVEVRHFYNAEELKNWWSTLNGTRNQVLLFCDYFLGKGAANGLKVIEDLGAEKQSVLVTGLAEDMNIQAECQRLMIPLLPKEKISTVSFHVA